MKGKNVTTEWRQGKLYKYIYIYNIKCLEGLSVSCLTKERCQRVEINNIAFVSFIKEEFYQHLFFSLLFIVVPIKYIYFFFPLSCNSCECDEFFSTLISLVCCSIYLYNLFFFFFSLFHSRFCGVENRGQ